jgi:phosphoserine phosphatase RsbU/P
MWRSKLKREANAGGVENHDDLVSLREENLRLRRAVEQLVLLNDLSQAMGLSENSDEMIQAIVRRAKQSLAAEQVMIYFIERKDGADIFQTKMRDDTVRSRRAFHFDDALRALMDLHRAPFRTSDPHREPRLHGVEFDRELRSLLCVPLMVRGTVTGLIAACNKEGAAGFDDEDQRLLGIIANHSAQILETTRLREDEAAFARLNRDLQLAREIQSGLLPTSPPPVAGFDIAGCSVPAEAVGGDYFDFIELDEGRLGICLGDVSGKGVPAALLMSNLQATMRGQAHVNPSAGECVRWANRLLYRSTGPDKFATLFYGVLDPRDRTLSYCNAGHEKPLLLACSPAGRCVEELALGGLVLGVLEDFIYAESRLHFAPGMTLLIYSDGLTDALDRADGIFGVAGVERVLQGMRGASSQEILAALRRAVADHSRGVPAFDDLTLIVIRCLGGA